MDLFKALRLGLLLNLIVIICGAKQPDLNITMTLPAGCESYAIVSKDSLIALSGYHFRAFFEDTPVMVFSNYILELDDTLSNPVLLPFDDDFSDINWLNGDCFFSADSTIYLCEMNGGIRPLICADRCINRFDVSHDEIVFSLGSTLYLYSIDDKSCDALYTAPGNIFNIQILQGVIFFSSGNDLFVYTSKQVYRIYSTDFEISAFAVHPNGSIFFGTEHAVYCISPNYRIVKIVDKGVNEMRIIKNNLYIIFNDDSSVYITESSLFLDLLAEV